MLTNRPCPGIAGRPNSRRGVQVTRVSGRGVVLSTFGLGGAEGTSRAREGLSSGAHMKPVAGRKSLGARIHHSFMAVAAGLVAIAAPSAAWAQNCARTITADVVVFDQPLMFN